MTKSLILTPQETAIRAHDITVCLERTSVPEYDLLSTLGMAVRLSLHLRGVQAVSYSLVRNVAIYLLDFPPAAVRPVLEFLDEAEFVRLVTEGKTIKTIIPDIPFYDKLFADLGELSSQDNFSEPELLTLTLVHRLADSPVLQDHVYNLGAEKKLVRRILEIGEKGSFIINRRARGRSVLISPTYFSESTDGYANLVATDGANRVKKILKLLKENPGWPLIKFETDRELHGTSLNDQELAIIRKLAGDGFLPPPAIETKHAGTNYFLFGPRPGKTKLVPSKRPIYEAAMALVAAVRQGQLLPAKYAIKWPRALLQSFKDKGFLRANTEALQQYRQVVILKVGRLEKINSDWAKLVLIERPENIEAVNMAIEMISGSEPRISSQDEIVLALREGEKYVESLISRKRIMEEKIVEIDEETQSAIDSFLLRGRE